MTNTAHYDKRDAEGRMWFGDKRDAPGVEGLDASISALLDTAIVAHEEAEYAATRGSGKGDVAIKRIGAGYIGIKCDRELAFKYHKVPVEKRKSVVSPGELNRHGAAGHWTEAKTAEWLRLAGFQVMTEDPGKQHLPEFMRQLGFHAAKDPETGKFRMAGQVDGVITGVPLGLENRLPLPCVWESKKATNKKWNTFRNKGVAKADPKYYGQVQTCMAYMQIEHTLFSMLNLDNMKYYWELIPFDRLAAQHLTDRAVRILQSRTPEEMPRITSDKTSFSCRFCDYQEGCWDVPVAPAAPAPPWVSSGESNDE